MSAIIKWRAFLCAVSVISVGSLLHFFWEWSGRSTFVAVFAAVNESTWEHLKLAFWPALIITPVQRIFYGPAPGWPVATAIRCIFPALLIVLMFYGYTALLGGHYLIADLSIFAIAIFVGEFVGHAVLSCHFEPTVKVGALGLIILATLLFSTLTFIPSDFFLFHSPSLK